MHHLVLHRLLTTNSVSVGSAPWNLAPPREQGANGNG
jgi:hypothetical protein